MKLRLRSIESKETLKIEVPNPCTLPQLQQILSQSLPSSPPPASIRLSLNRKDDLRSDGEESLNSLGIATGDLIFFSLRLEGGTISNTENTPPPISKSSPIQELKKDSEAGISNSMALDSPKGETLHSEGKEGDYMEVEDDGSEIRVSSDCNSFSIPAFLRKVFTEGLDNGGRDHKLIVTAIHAVMLESGFVAFDRVANAAISGFRCVWPSKLLGMSLYYTLPGTLNGDSSKDIKFVVLKFQILGKFITVYGSLSSGSGKGGTHRVHLNEDELIPFLNVVWANFGDSDIIPGADETFTSPEKEVFKFWRIVKDNLALPLLIDLSEEAGLELPPCFMRLPTDLKLKILESLQGVHLASVSCVCSELQYLGSNDDFWKLKFSEEFGHGTKEPYGSWKNAFAASWNRRNTRNLENRVRPSPFWPAPYAVPSRRRHPNPFMVPRVPRIIGGDYDIYPQPFGDDMHGAFLDSASHRRMKFSPHCNLGFRGGRFL